MVSGFIGDWPGDLGDASRAVDPGQSVSAARLQAAAGKESVSDARSLVVPRSCLRVVRPQLKDALSQQSWAALFGLQITPTALDAVNLPGGARCWRCPSSATATFASYLAPRRLRPPPGCTRHRRPGAVNTLVAGQPARRQHRRHRLDRAPTATRPRHRYTPWSPPEQQVFQRSSSIP